METKNRAYEGISSLEVSPEQGTVGRRILVHKRRIITFLVVSLFSVALLALLGSQLLVPAQNQSHSGSAQSGSPLEGHPAPDFTLAALSTQAAPAVHLASLKGKLVMLNFWASWCVPCQHEAPLLQTTWQHVQSQGIVFLGIDFEDRQGDALNFLQQYGITYPNVVDSDGSVAINYGVTGVPETFFIDRRGVIMRKVTGELSEQTLQSNLQLLVREASH